MKLKNNKFFFLILAELVILIFFLPGCFKQEEYIYSFLGEDILTQVEWIEETDRFVSESIKLQPGVYQIRAKANVGKENLIYLRIDSSSSNFMSVRCNDVPIWPGQAYVDFEIYVLDKAEINIVCDFYGEQADSLAELELYRTNRGSRMLVFALIIVFVLFDLLLLLRKKILEGKVNRQQQAVFWILSACVLLSYLPYLTDYFSLGADGAFHITRIEGLAQTLLQGGQFPVKVQSYWLYDHGYAVSAFYGDLFLLIPAMLRIIGFSVMTAYKTYVFLAMAATAAVAYFSFYKCVRNRYAALFGSAFYVLAPYRIYNFYNRDALGEYTAMIFFPLLCCGLYLMFTENIHEKKYKRNKIYLILGLTGLLQCHLLSCEMAAGIILLVCLVMWKKTFRKETFLQLAQAAVTALLVNCWFWLPLLYMLAKDHYYLSDLISQNIQSRGTQLAGVFQLFPNMRGAQTGMYNCEPIQIGAASLLMILFYFMICIYRKFFRREKSGNPYGTICRFLVIMTIFMVALSTKYFPWDLLAEIPLLGHFVTSIQFPTRMLAPASVFAAMLAAFFPLWLHQEGIWLVQKEERRKVCVNGCLFFLTVIAAGSAVYHVNSIAYFAPVLRLYNTENMGSAGVVNGEYMLEGTAIGDYHFHGPTAEEGLEWSDYNKNGVNISIEIANTTGQPRFIELPITGYRGYGIDATAPAGEDVPVIDEQRGAHGDLKIVVPAGYEGRISVSYKGFFLFRAAEWISLLSILGTALFLINRKVFRNSTGDDEAVILVEENHEE